MLNYLFAKAIFVTPCTSDLPLMETNPGYTPAGSHQVSYLWHSAI